MRAVVLSLAILAGCVVQVPGHDHTGTELRMGCGPCGGEVQRIVVSTLQQIQQQNRQGVAPVESGS